MKSSTLQKSIMRRVYFSYMLQIVAHPVTAYTAGFLVLGWWITELVFFARIWQAFVSTPVGELGSFSIGLVSGADGLTLVVFVLFMLLFVGLARQLAHGLEVRLERSTVTM